MLHAETAANAGASTGCNPELTFAPAICSASERLLEENPDMPADFLERQRFFWDQRQRRIQALQEEASPNLMKLVACVGIRWLS